MTDVDQRGRGDGRSAGRVRRSGPSGRAAARRSRWAIDLRPLGIPDFRRLWLGNGASTYGFQFTAVAVPVEMYALTGGSFWVGLIGLAALLPLLVFGLWGGAVADAVDRRRLLLAGSGLMWVTTVTLLTQSVFAVGSPVLLLVLVAVQSAAFAISSPARNAIVPRLVPTGLVPAAVTLNFTTGQVGGVLGPLTVGAVLSLWPTAVALPVAYGVDAALLAYSLLVTYRLPPIPPEVDAAGNRAYGLRGVLDGLRYLTTTPVLLLSLVIDVIAMVLAMPRSLFPEVAQERFAGGAAVGWLFSAISIGSVLGGLTSGWIGRVRRQGLALVIAVLAWGLAIAAAGLARQLWLMVVLLAVAGAADLVSAVFRLSILQVYAPDRMRGRLQGVNMVVVAGGPRLGDLRAGATAAGFGVGLAWVGGGLAAVVLVVLLAVACPALVRYTGAGGSDEPSR